MTTLSTTTNQRSVERIAAVALIAIGALILISPFAGQLGIYGPAVIGAFSLVAFIATRQYGFAVASGVMGGAGAAIILATSTSDVSLGGAAFMGSVAAGFALVWILGLVARPAETHPWPLVPAALLGSIGVAAATGLPIIANVAMAGFALALLVVGIRQLSR